MSSARKTAANRENAKQSTGPKSVTGRKVVRHNALKHGLTAETLIVEGEDSKAFRLMADAHLAVFRPANDVELEFATTFTLAAWRRRRCVSTETAMVNRYIHETQLAEELIQQQHVLALGDRLFHDSQGYWQLFPDPSLEGCPMSHRTNEAPGGPDLPARLVNELESSYAGCQWLLERWNEIRVRNLPPTFLRPLDKFKTVRLLGRQPLEVLEDTTGDLLVIFLASHAIHPVNKSPFSELRCEVCDDQFGTVRRRLERRAAAERHAPTNEDEGRRLLDNLIAQNTWRLEQLALKHRTRAEAEAAESTSRLAFDPGAAADKVRRYEDASIRRMTRACDDLAKLRRSGIFDEDAQEQPEPARACQRRAAPGSRGDSADLDRCEQPGNGEGCESSAQAEETGCDEPTLMSEPTVDGPRCTVDGERPPACETANIDAGARLEESASPADMVHTWATASGGWGRSPESDAPRSEASALGARPPRRAQPQPPNSWLPPCDDLESCPPAAAQASETIVESPPSRVHRERPASGETTDIEADAPPEQSGSPATTELSKPTADSPRSTLHGSSGPWIVLLLVACWWWFAASGQGAALRGSPMSPSPVATRARRPLAQNKATAICTGRADCAERLTVAVPLRNRRGESDWTGGQRPTRREPAARNKATAIGSDSAEHCAPGDRRMQIHRGTDCQSLLPDPMRREPAAPNKATAIGSDSAEHSAPGDRRMQIHRGTDCQSLLPDPMRREPAARNKATAIGSDSAEHCAPGDRRMQIHRGTDCQSVLRQSLGPEYVSIRRSL